MKRLRLVLLLLASTFALAHAHASEIARFEVLGGDRQIAVVTTVQGAKPQQPYVVRALDAAGIPVVGAVLFVGPATDPGQAFLQDEFHFVGFHVESTSCFTCFGSVPPTYIATTDSNGVASWRAPDPFAAPSAFAIGTRPLATTSSVRAFWSVVTLLTVPMGRPSVVVEYFNAALGHYFNTLDQVEIDALDAAKFVGWKRSIGAFVAYASAQDAPSGAVPVCRFFSPVYTSHFYTADTEECATVESRWPDVWILESRTAFYIHVPDKVTGTCAAGLQPIYRMYNNQPIPNHRYIADKKLRDRMTGAGWRAEGYGPDAVMMCTPS